MNGEFSDDLFIDDPNVSAANLRFEVGSHVVCCLRKKGWFTGRIMKVAQRSASSNVSIPYLVYSDYRQEVMGIPMDSDEFIRPKPLDLSPDPANFHPSWSHPKDPLAHLYTKQNNI